MVTWATEVIGSRFLFLLALIAFLRLAGYPVHLGIICLANLELGYLTPPVGLNLFFASYRFGKPVVEILRAVLPLFAALGAGVLAITYLPWLSTGLLSLTR